MAERKDSHEFPLSCPRWLVGLFGAVLLLLALSMVVSSAAPIFHGAVALILVILPFCALFMVPGVYLIRLAATMVVLNPEEVCIYRFGRLKLRIPTDRLSIYLCGDAWHNRLFFCLCPYTIEELAAFRESELQKGALSRNELVFCKRVARWQNVFAGEYIMRWTARGLRDPVKKYLIELYCTLETESALKRYFPQTPCQQLGTLPSREFRMPCKQGTERFGGREGESSVWALGIALTALLLLAVTPLLALEWGLPVLPVTGGVFLVSLGLGALLWPRNQAFQPAPEGIQLGGKQPRLIPAESIRLIAKIGTWQDNGAIHYFIVVTELTVEELARRQTQYLCRSASGRRTMGLYAQIPNGEETLARRYCSRRILWHGGTDQELLVAVYTPEREKLLRELYPHAQWLDWPEGMF